MKSIFLARKSVSVTGERRQIICQRIGEMMHELAPIQWTTSYTSLRLREGAEMGEKCRIYSEEFNL